MRPPFVVRRLRSTNRVLREICRPDRCALYRSAGFTARRPGATAAPVLVRGTTTLARRAGRTGDEGRGGSLGQRRPRHVHRTAADRAGSAPRGPWLGDRRLWTGIGIRSPRGCPLWAASSSPLWRPPTTSWGQQRPVGGVGGPGPRVPRRRPASTGQRPAVTARRERGNATARADRSGIDRRVHRWGHHVLTARSAVPSLLSRVQPAGLRHNRIHR